MNTASPLRYPGGKSAMSGLLSDIRYLNGIGDRDIAEPYAGGAGASLALLYLERCNEIYINDADPSIYSMWWSLVHRPRPFHKKITFTPVSVKEWRRQREIFHSRATRSHLRRGFAAFYLNRCNRSGIIMNGGPIGGPQQAGKWKIDARFNKQALRQRCEKIAEYRDRINVSNCDGIDFINGLDSDKTFFFIDPPYFHKGQLLYINHLDTNYHRKLAEVLRSLQDSAWVLTYDDCPEIRAMYRGWAKIKSFSLRYTAAQRRMGNEIMVVPKWMKLPTTQASAALLW